MSTSRVGETFDERPMTELMLLIGKDFVHFFWPRCGPRGPLISLQQRNAGEKKRLSCVGEQKGKFMAAESRLIEVAELQK